MTLLEEIENEKQQLAELDNPVEEAEQQTEEEGVENGSEPETSEEEPSGETEAESGELEEGSAEEAEEEPEQAEETKPKGYERIRKKREEQGRVKELEKQIEELKKGGQESGQEEVEEAQAPDINSDPVGWLQWRDEQYQKQIDSLTTTLEQERAEKAQKDQYSQAVQEFVGMEQSFSSQVDDYEDVSAFFKKRMEQNIKASNPFITDAQLKDAVNNQILVTASNLLNQGFNPVEEMYHIAKDELGFVPKPKEEVSQAQQQTKPDLGKVAQNRKRNAGMAGAGGGAKPAMTLEAAANLDIDEWSKLPASEKKRLLGTS